MTATVRLVLFLAAVKAISASTNRDYVYLRIVAFLELLAACVISANLNFFAFLALFLIFAIGTFAAGEIRRSAMRKGVVVRVAEGTVPMRLGSLTGALAVGILIMTCGLFYLLPRTARAALHLVSNRYFVTGFSNDVHIGGTGEIEQRKTAVLHILMDDGGPPGPLKWKGGTLAQFDGHRWFNPPGLTETFARNHQGCFTLEPSIQRLRDPNERTLTYVVHVGEEAGGALFFSGDPAYLCLDVPSILRSAPGSYRPRFDLGGGFSYQASSFAQRSDLQAAGDAPSSALREMYLQLPRLDPRIAQLAATVSVNGASKLAKARMVERYLRDNYTYTLRQADKPVADPLATFLFDRRKGHCEYFASALAVMLRTLDIPTRVATGFEGGIYNPISGRQLIRASDAHSWVEAWLPDRGWITLDATPPALAADETMSSRFSMWIDAASVFWQDWVLDYNLSQQLTLAARVEESSRRFRFAAPDLFSVPWWNARRDRGIQLAQRYGFPAVVVLLALGGLVWLGPLLARRARTRGRVRGIQHGDVRAGDATLLYQRMLRLLHRRGIEKPAWLTPFEFAALVREPDLAVLVEDVTRAYNELRFGEHPAAAQRMIHLLEQLEQHPIGNVN